jgi:hypothetical protein
MFTRTQYIHGECSHRTYYAQFVNKAVMGVVERRFTTERLVRCSDQEYFNTIPLHQWDQLTPAVQAFTDRQMLRDAVEGWSLSTGVCIAKEAGRQLVEAYHAMAMT